MRPDHVWRVCRRNAAKITRREVRAQGLFKIGGERLGIGEPHRGPRIRITFAAVCGFGVTIAPSTSAQVSSAWRFSVA